MSYEAYDEDLEHDEALEESEDSMEPIAVIAMAGRFPGAQNVEDFWSNIRNGVESVKFFTDEELIESNIDPALLKNPKFVKADAVLDDMDLFDAEFFSYSPREAEIMDPQHRLFLETAWEVVERAGYNPDTYKGRVGVFAGSGLSSYLIRNLLHNSEFVDSVGSFNTMLANGQDFLSTKVAFKMNFMGPAVNVNTLCSSSMVGVHMGCQSLWDFQTDMCLAGGVSLQASRNEAFFYQEGGIGAFDGHCRAFDARARGTVSGSGLGVVVLKRLEDAEEDGDNILALIRGSAINNDGSMKISYTAPSIDGQAEVIAEAQNMADIDPATISLIECHGTGTSLGDPIEISGLTKAFQANSESLENQFCAIGSVKTNIGHLVSAGGVASLIKVVGALQDRVLPPSLNYETPNPKIDFESSPFFVNTELRDWEPEGPRRAGISSFGIGGTNAHLVVEEAPEPKETDDGRAKQLVLISARTETGLATATRNMADFLAENPDTNFADAAYTLKVGRRAFAHRTFLVRDNPDDVVEALRSESPSGVYTGYQESKDRPVIFMFSGQGAQYAGMAAEIYQQEATFQEVVDQCADYLNPLLGLDLRGLMFPAAGEEATASEKLADTRYTQPALFTIEYAMAKLWMSWGVEPKAMIGHSIGEYVAATLAGVFDLEDALKLVAERGRLIASLPKGDMLAIPKPEADITPLLNDQLSLSVINGASACVVSGPAQAIADLKTELKSQGIGARILDTSHAFHSHMMDPILGDFTRLVESVIRNKPETAFVSNVSGDWITDEDAVDPSYWARHLRGTVRFHDGLQKLFKDETDLLLEVGPGATLANLAKRNPGKPEKMLSLASIRHPKERSSDYEFLMTQVGRLWLAGVTLDWDKFYAGETRLRTRLPTYPFERRRYWIEPDMLSFQSGSDSGSGSMSIRSGRLADASDWFYVPSWKQSAPLPMPHELPPNQTPWLVFIDDSGLGSDFGKRLQDYSQTVLTVSLGEGFARMEDAVYKLNPGKPEDFTALMEDLAGRDIKPGKIVSFWGVGGAGKPEEVRERSFYSMLNLIKTIAATPATDPLKLIAVSSGAVEVTGEDLEPEKARTAGLMYSISQELPHVVCRTVDLPTTQYRTWQQTRLVDRLVAEVTGDSDARAVALNKRGRFEETYEPQPLVPTEPKGLRNKGAYLIVGGLGNMGLELAHHMARTAQARLVLTGRSNFPAREEWDGYLRAHAASDPISRKIIKLRQIEADGGQVLAVAADVTDETRMRVVLEDLKRNMGPLRGVIHVAGKMGRQVFRSVSEISKADCEGMFNAKTEGLQTLETVLEGVNLDFCYLVSSVSAVLGGMGLSGYAAASAYMDAFTARHNQESPVQWTVLDWDAWRLDEALLQNLPGGDAVTALALSVEEGVETFQRLLAHPELDRVIISTEDIRSRLRAVAETEERLRSKQKNYTIHPRPNLSNPYVAPRNDVEERVAEVWQERLGIDKVGIHDNFFDLGGDSLLVVRVRMQIQEAFKTELLTSDLFEHPTVAAIAEYLGNEDSGQNLAQAADRAQLRRTMMDDDDEDDDILLRLRGRR